MVCGMVAVTCEGLVIAGVPGVSLSAKGEYLAYAGRGKDGKGAVVVLDVEKNAELARVETIQPAPVFPTLAPDGSSLVTHGPPAAARAEPSAPTAVACCWP